MIRFLGEVFCSPGAFLGLVFRRKAESVKLSLRRNLRYYNVSRDENPKAKVLNATCRTS